MDVLSLILDPVKDKDRRRHIPTFCMFIIFHLGRKTTPFGRTKSKIF